MYRIKYENYKTDEGDVVHNYYVQKYVTFLWFSYWKYCKVTYYAYCDVYSGPVSFNSEEKAVEFINKMKAELPSHYTKGIY